MGFRRGLSTTGIFVARRLRPSYCHIHHGNCNEPVQSPPDKSQFITANYLPHAAYSASNLIGSRSRTRPYLSFAASAGISFPYSRYMSSSSGEGSGGDIFAEVITESTMDIASQVPSISEVAVAAADSAYPVAALQYVIDGVHSFTGLNWWAAIALTTVLIRGATIPLLINQLKSTSRLNLMRPQLEELNQKFNNSTMDAEAVGLHKQRVMALFKEHGVTPFTPMKGLLIQGPVFISFFLAIRNMVEKVPSFQTGGALWFTDLTTPDGFYILPLLTALTFWITVECNMQEGLEGNPIAGTMKYFSRIFAVISVPVMIGFPQAIFGYWLTSNIFSLCYGLVIKQPGVKKYFDIPEVPDQPPSAKQSPSPLSLFSASKGDDNDNGDDATKQEPEPDYYATSTTEPRRAARQISSSSVLSQRIRSLEKRIRASKKNKKKKNKC